MEKIHASLVLEIMGRPKEHVESAIKGLVEKLGNEKGVKLISKTIHAPIPIENSKDLLTTFAEVEVTLDGLENYFSILFAYMPSNIEIIKPESLSLSNSLLNTLANSLLQRLHNYDTITKNM